VSAADLGLGALVALVGWLTPPFSVGMVVALIAETAAFALLFDAIKGAGAPPIGDRLIGAIFLSIRQSPIASRS